MISGQVGPSYMVYPLSGQNPSKQAGGLRLKRKVSPMMTVGYGFHYLISKYINYSCKFAHSYGVFLPYKLSGV